MHRANGRVPRPWLLVCGVAGGAGSQEAGRKWVQASAGWFPFRRPCWRRSAPALGARDEGVAVADILADGDAVLELGHAKDQMHVRGVALDKRC